MSRHHLFSFRVEFTLSFSTLSSRAFTFSKDTTKQNCFKYILLNLLLQHIFRCTNNIRKFRRKQTLKLLDILKE